MSIGTILLIIWSSYYSVDLVVSGAAHPTAPAITVAAGSVS